MSGMSDYLVTKLIDHVLRNTAYTKPWPVYLGLFTVQPGDDGTGGTEVVGGSYARKAITFGADSGGVTFNTAALTFDVPACTIVAGGIFDAVSGVNMLFNARFTQPRTVLAGTFSIQVGDVVVQL